MPDLDVQGTAVPALGLGTYRLRGKAAESTVREAIELGYRHIDTAEYYENQAAIGAAIEEAAVDREELFVTTKIWHTNLEAAAAKQSARASLAKLGLETIDLLLIHWPSDRVPIEETIGAMNELQAAGRVDHIGVSNFSIDQLEAAIEASRTPIFTNQVEYNPYTSRPELHDFSVENDILLTAYSPLAKGTVIDDPVLESIGDRYGKSPAQVTLRWLCQQKNVAAIPKATSRAHLEANREINDFELTDEEMTEIASLGSSS